MREQKKLNTIRKIKSKNSEAFFLVIRGLEVGLVAGLIAVLYRYMLSVAEDGLNKILTFVHDSWWKIAIWFGILWLIGTFVSYIIKWEPAAGGSGIPQVTGEVKGRMSPSWWKVLVAKLIGGTASVFAGLSLGREGPSVQLGGMAAKGVAKITKADKTTELRMISCGAGAGMAAAFNAPLAGIMFVLEEIHHSFDKNILCMGIVSTVVADFVSKMFFGQNTIFNYSTVTFPLKYYWILILLGIILGLSGVGYTKIMLKILDCFKGLKKIPNNVKLPIVFVFSGIVGLICPQVLCGGHSMVEFLMNEKPGFSVMFTLLVAKFLFGAICFACGAPGGTLYPLCILGTYLGASFGMIALNISGLPNELWQEFAVIGMAGFFSATIKSPITGIVLVFELTGNMNNLLPLVTVALISFAVSDLLGSEPIYEALLARLSATPEEIKEKDIAKREKIIKSFVIPTGSDLANKRIKDIDWGRHALIITVERGEDSITPNGDIVLKAGDEIVFLVSQRRLAKTSEHLEKLFEDQYKPSTTA
ncbi:ClC family H(+)/Cl(-) exchange transporter [Eubacterium coprostanoligenes]|uniref:ClC family H(+)/Cl(-) exchange transporter n=1 Tax=Eubacterium coprostanoligenes TaxID=290054 RepID=UPI0023EF72C7|nr:ClC family H(+)/Cl(-) exchange transporter [Eubacterium coprostanoligenes]